MKIVPAGLPGVLVIEPTVFRDARGYFFEAFRQDRYAEAGITAPFVQHNQSSSVKGTLRGLHLQVRHPQAKLVRVLSGSIWDVAVDVRVGSPTFGKWVSAELSAENFRQMYVPIGFAHGFLVTSDEAEVEYKCSDVYDPGGELGIRWNDPEIGVVWPVLQPLLSAKDQVNPFLQDVRDRLPR